MLIIAAILVESLVVLPLIHWLGTEGPSARVERCIEAAGRRIAREDFDTWLSRHR